MDKHPLKVTVVGAGTGGLCQAPGLKKDGIAANVFKRDRTPTDRLQSYRLSLSVTGNKALKECPSRPLVRLCAGALEKAPAPPHRCEPRACAYDARLSSTLTRFSWVRFVASNSGPSLVGKESGRCLRLALFLGRD